MVSIVTCTYNRAHLIGETIQSVLDQTCQEFEYIIVDDGSVDNTEEIIQAFNDKRIHFFKHPRTGGHLSLLRNFAHTKCSGKFIAYIDSDDLWVKDKLELQLKGLFESPSASFSFTDVDYFNENGVFKNSLYNKSGVFTGSVFKNLLDNKLIINHTSLLLKRSCLDKTGPMDESFHSGDHDLVFFLSRFFEAFVLYRPLVHVRKHDQNSTANNDLSIRLLKEHHKTLEKLFKSNLITRKEFRNALAKTSYSFGIQLGNIKEHHLATRCFIKCLSIWPWHVKSLYRLVITYTSMIFG